MVLVVDDRIQVHKITNRQRLSDFEMPVREPVLPVRRRNVEIFRSREPLKQGKFRPNAVDSRQEKCVHNLELLGSPEILGFLNYILTRMIVDRPISINNTKFIN